MDLNKLYYFYVVAKHEHVTKASEELCVAQPAVTKTIKQLERELDVSLFQKQGRNIKLTVFGEHLKERLEEVFSVLETLPEELEKLKAEQSQTIRLNVLAASAVVTNAVIEYKKNHPEVIFQFVQHEEKQECDISVLTNELHVGSDIKFRDRCVIEEKIYLAVPKKSRYAHRPSIQLQEVCDEGFVTLASSRSFRGICDMFCAYAGFRPKIIFESDSPETVKNIIQSNVGVAFWPEFSWGKLSGTSDIVLLPIETPTCRREIVIELHEHSPEPEPATSFYEYLVTYLKDIQTGK